MQRTGEYRRKFGLNPHRCLYLFTKKKEKQIKKKCLTNTHHQHKHQWTETFPRFYSFLKFPTNLWSENQILCKRILVSDLQNTSTLWIRNLSIKNKPWDDTQHIRNPFLTMSQTCCWLGNRTLTWLVDQIHQRLVVLPRFQNFVVNLP